MTVWYSPGVGWFYCCLAVPERTVMRQTAEGLILTLWTGIPVAVWYAFWAVTAHSDPEYPAAFLGLYHLEIATIDVDGVPTEVVRPDAGGLLFWIDVGLYILTPAAACLDGCQQSKRPTPQ